MWCDEVLTYVSKLLFVLHVAQESNPCVIITFMWKSAFDIMADQSNVYIVYSDAGFNLLME